MNFAILSALLMSLCGSSTMMNRTTEKYISVYSYAGGSKFACGILVDGHVQCWNGFPNPPSNELFSSIYVGIYDRACGITLGGKIQCWHQGGDVISVPNGDDFVRISFGRYCACALRVNGSVICWNNGGSGCGIIIPPTDIFIDLATTLSTDNYVCLLNTDNTVACYSYSSLQGIGFQKSSRSDIIQISFSNSILYCLTRSGYVIQFYPNSLSSWTELGEKFNQISSNCVVRDGVMVKNNFGTFTGNFNEITCSKQYYVLGTDGSCASFTNGSVICWGTISNPPSGLFFKTLDCPTLNLTRSIKNASLSVSNLKNSSFSCIGIIDIRYNNLTSLSVSAFNISRSSAISQIYFTEGNSITSIVNGSFYGLDGVISINTKEYRVMDLRFNYGLKISPYFLNGISQYIRVLDLTFCNIRSIPNYAFVYPNSYFLSKIKFIQGNNLNESLRPALFKGLNSVQSINSETFGVCNLSNIGREIEVFPNFMAELGIDISYADISANLISELPAFAFNKSSLTSLWFWNGNMIKSLFKGVFQNLPNIRYIDTAVYGKIDLSGNSLQRSGYSLRVEAQFLEGIGEDISSLDISNNNIIELPRNSFNYSFSSRLLSLNFSTGNQITYFSNGTFNGLSSISKINSFSPGYMNLSSTKTLVLEAGFMNGIRNSIQILDLRGFCLDTLQDQLFARDGVNSLVAIYISCVKKIEKGGLSDLDLVSGFRRINSEVAYEINLSGVQLEILEAGFYRDCRDLT
jgi:hypothetical protein